MSTREMFFCNDNVRTSHLKCNRCKTQNSLKGIERSKGFETRLFECAHCGAVKAIRIDTPETITGWSKNARSSDRGSC
jgi:uncharacterized Zn finger protein